MLVVYNKSLWRKHSLCHSLIYWRPARWAKREPYHRFSWTKKKIGRQLKYICIYCTCFACNKYIFSIIIHLRFKDLAKTWSDMLHTCEPRCLTASPVRWQKWMFFGFFFFFGLPMYWLYRLSLHFWGTSFSAIARVHWTYSFHFGYSILLQSCTHQYQSDMTAQTPYPIGNAYHQTCTHPLYPLPDVTCSFNSRYYSEPRNRPHNNIWYECII